MAGVSLCQNPSGRRLLRLHNLTRGHVILSLSPERFLRIEDGVITTQPIKGTAPRHSDPKTDAALAQQLIDSEKDRAENIMITDLLRNDLGQFCEPGTVTVTELCGLRSYGNVHHLVSTVRGTQGRCDARTIIARVVARRLYYRSTQEARRGDHQRAGIPHSRGLLRIGLRPRRERLDAEQHCDPHVRNQRPAPALLGRWRHHSQLRMGSGIPRNTR